MEPRTQRAILETGSSDRDVTHLQCSVQADPCFALNIKETNNNDNKIITVEPKRERLGSSHQLSQRVTLIYYCYENSKLQKKADFSHLSHQVM